MSSNRLQSIQQPQTWAVYRRYTDHCIGATSYSREELNQFIAAVNSFLPALKNIWEISNTSLAFLDIKVSIEGNGLCTSVHCKPTDSHNYLLCSSSHPLHDKNSISYFQFLRLCGRLSSELSDFPLKSEEMCDFLRQTWVSGFCFYGQHYKRHRRKTMIKFHSPSYFTLTATRQNPSF